MNKGILIGIAVVVIAAAISISFSMQGGIEDQAKVSEPIQLEDTVTGSIEQIKENSNEANTTKSGNVISLEARESIGLGESP